MNDTRSKITILIVDDEFIFREINKKRIADYFKKDKNFDIITADGFKIAIEIAKKRSIDVVFTDLQMDGRKDCGISLSRHIKVLNPKTKVFIASNTDIERIEKNADTKNISGFFQLPLKHTDLEQVFCKPISDSDHT